LSCKDTSQCESQSHHQHQLTFITSQRSCLKYSHILNVGVGTELNLEHLWMRAEEHCKAFPTPIKRQAVICTEGTQMWSVHGMPGVKCKRSFNNTLLITITIAWCALVKTRFQFCRLRKHPKYLL
jgi:hypothetical protein